MPLPKLDVPTYEIVLPLSKIKIKYRPFLVKEQRNLLMAVESDDAESIQRAVRDILYNCTLNEDVDIEKLPIVDVEYYFLQLRAKSVGEIVELKYRCNNEPDGEHECGNLMDTQIDLKDVSVETTEGVSPEIQLDDKIAVKLKYPEFKIVLDSVNIDSINEVTFNMIANSIEHIYDGQQFHYASESTPQELLQFVESMNQEQFERVENFFNNLPKIRKVMNLTCSKCGFNHTIPVEGLEDFFV